MTTPAFCHLHVHSEYSILDASCRINALAARTAAFGQPALALTDHCVMTGAVELVEACARHGVQPIVGCEILLVDDHAGPPECEIPHHLTLLATGVEGYRSLCRLSSAGFLDGPRRSTPTVDIAQIAAHADGVLALSGCFASRLARRLVADRVQEARHHADDLLQIFGAENVYFELQRHGIAGEEKANEGVIRIARELRRPIVATADVHYLTASDYAAHAALRAGRTTGTLVEPQTALGANEFYLRSTEEMVRLFGDLPEAIATTIEVAERCRGNLELFPSSDHLPDYPLTRARSQSAFLRHTVMAGLRARYGDPVPPVAATRCEAELSLIERHGYSSYFLIVWDMVSFARTDGIVVGPGRGSAAASIVNYALRITDVDPLAHDLLFERFLRQDGIVAPDIDIDFSVRGRGRVLRHLIDVYGRDRVAQVSTFQRFFSRSATHAATRVLGHDQELGDHLARLIPDPSMGRAPSLASCLSPREPLQTECARNPTAREIIQLAEGLEGVVRDQSVHPCALVIGDRPLTDVLPLQLVQLEMDGQHSAVPVSQYSMRPTQRLGLLKLDLLGMRNLDVLEVAIGRIETASGKRPDLATVELDDAATLDLFSRGDTSDVFQFTTDEQRKAAAVIKPDCFEDLAAIITLERPSARRQIPEYASAKRDPRAVEYLDERLRTILETTHGVLLYQEQQMQIAMALAGFAASRGDDLRRAFGRKDRDALAVLRVDFVDGSRRSGTTKEVTEQAWHQLERGSDWTFSRSHAVSYALIAYWTAWVKAHHPREFREAVEEVANSD